MSTTHPEEDKDLKIKELEEKLKESEENVKDLKIKELEEQVRIQEEAKAKKERESLKPDKNTKIFAAVIIIVVVTVSIIGIVIAIMNYCDEDCWAAREEQLMQEWRRFPIIPLQLLVYASVKLGRWEAFILHNLCPFPNYRVFKEIIGFL